VSDALWNSDLEGGLTITSLWPDRILRVDAMEVIPERHNVVVYFSLRRADGFRSPCIPPVRPTMAEIEKIWTDYLETVRLWEEEPDKTLRGEMLTAPPNPEPETDLSCAQEWRNWLDNESGWNWELNDSMGTFYDCTTTGGVVPYSGDEVQGELVWQGLVPPEATWLEIRFYSGVPESGMPEHGENERRFTIRAYPPFVVASSVSGPGGKLRPGGEQVL
jgi:hypothetical protein